jgi:hypothetical protein
LDTILSLDNIMLFGSKSVVMCLCGKRAEVIEFSIWGGGETLRFQLVRKIEFFIQIPSIQLVSNIQETQPLPE